MQVPKLWRHITSGHATRPTKCKLLRTSIPQPLAVVLLAALVVAADDDAAGLVLAEAALLTAVFTSVDEVAALVLPVFPLTKVPARVPELEVPAPLLLVVVVPDEDAPVPAPELVPALVLPDGAADVSDAPVPEPAPVVSPPPPPSLVLSRFWPPRPLPPPPALPPSELLIRPPPPRALLEEAAGGVWLAWLWSEGACCWDWGVGEEGGEQMHTHCPVCPVWGAR